MKEEVKTMECPYCSNGEVGDQDQFGCVSYSSCSNCNGKGTVPVCEWTEQPSQTDSTIKEYKTTCGSIVKTSRRYSKCMCGERTKVV
jgi:hypothetical protein